MMLSHHIETFLEESALNFWINVIPWWWWQ